MKTSIVYLIESDNLGKLEGMMPPLGNPLALKTHFGEDGNKTSLPAEPVKRIARMKENPVLVETSVLYRGRRSRASTHRELALENGFDFAPLDLLDGEEGDDSLEAEIAGDHFNVCYLGKGLEEYRSLLVVSHFKGHVLSGFGGALKNLGMGLASRRGKLNQHESIKHQVNKKKCIGCGVCIRHCPAEAISQNKNAKAEIDINSCISCSKCISVCPQEAIEAPMLETGTQTLQERIAEYAYAASRDKECFYINFFKEYY